MDNFELLRRNLIAEYVFKKNMGIKHKPNECDKEEFSQFKKDLSK